MVKISYKWSSEICHLAEILFCSSVQFLPQNMAMDSVLHQASASEEVNVVFMLESRPIVLEESRFSRCPAADASLGIPSWNPAVPVLYGKRLTKRKQLSRDHCDHVCMPFRLSSTTLQDLGYERCDLQDSWLPACAFFLLYRNMHPSTSKE